MKTGFILAFLFSFWGTGAWADSSQVLDSPQVAWFQVFFLEAEVTHNSKASAERIRHYQEILRDIESTREFSEQQWKEFTQVYFESLQAEAQAQGKLPRPYANRQTISGYFSVLKDRILARIPENVFAQGYMKYGQQFKPTAYVQTEIEKIILEHFKGMPKYQRPSATNIADLMGAWMRTTFSEKVPNSGLPSSFRGFSFEPTAFGYGLEQNIISYKKFLAQFAALDPQNTYGHRIHPGYSGHFELLSKQPVSKEQRYCGQFF